MARQQYRLSGEFDWVANSGAALVVVYNPIGSGRKITLGSFEIQNITGITAATPAAALPTVLSLSRASLSAGEAVPCLSADSQASALPSQIQVTRRASVVPSSILSRVQVAKRASNTISWLAMLRPHGVGRIYRSPRAASDVEGYTIRQGESIALYADVMNNTVPVRVTATFVVVVGSPNRTYTTTYFTNLRAANESLLSINNSAGSGLVVVLRSISVEEVGTFDTPYFRLVPVGRIDASDISDPFKDVTSSLIKMDSDYVSPTGNVLVLKNSVIYPFGMPENAFDDSSAGSPKGFSYLKTKDFVGPCYRVLFPEQVMRNSANSNDFVGFYNSHRAADLLVRRAGIVIQEGEAVALVSAAETAANATAAVGVAGWSSFSVSAQLTVEPKAAPSLVVTGMQGLCEVRVFVAGTQTLLAGQENISSGSFSWAYDPDSVTSVDVAILSLGYQNIRLTNVALGSTDVTLIVQQQLDRQYFNP